jgi:hypothetical protein
MREFPVKKHSLVNVVCLVSAVTQVILGLQGAIAASTDTRFSLRGFGSFGATGTDTNHMAFRRYITQREGATKS